MPRDPRTYLWDARQAVGLLRQFEIVGEALNQLRKVDAELAARIPDVNRIVAFRNILIHGYASVDDALVWQTLTDKVPVLETALDGLLDGAGG